MRISTVAIIALCALPAAHAVGRPPFAHQSLTKTIRPASRLPRLMPQTALSSNQQNRQLFAWAKDRFHAFAHCFHLGNHCCVDKSYMRWAMHEQLNFFKERLGHHREFLTKLALALGSDGNGACTDAEIQALMNESETCKLTHGFFVNSCELRSFERRSCEDPFGVIVRMSLNYVEQRLEQRVEWWHHYSLEEKRNMIKNELTKLSLEFGEIAWDMKEYFIPNASRFSYSGGELALLDQEAETVANICQAIRQAIYYHYRSLASPQHGE